MALNQSDVSLKSNPKQSGSSNRESEVVTKENNFGNIKINLESVPVETSYDYKGPYLLTVLAVAIFVFLIYVLMGSPFQLILTLLFTGFISYLIICLTND